MHDLTDDDRARLEKRYGSIEEIKRDFFPDLLAAERAAEKARREGEPDELGDALAVVEAACVEAREERDEARRKLAEQSSGDQVLRVWLTSDEAIRQLTGAIVRQADGEVISLAYENVRNCVEGVIDQYLAALSDSTDKEQGDG